MAGDWIKFDITTPDKPEVVSMAAELGIDQDAVVGKLLRVWTWADQNTVTCNGKCNAVTVTSAFLDRLTFCPGFAHAMRKVGWLLGEDGTLHFPNFERHNGKTAKDRAVSNRRVAKHRVGNGDVTMDVTVAPLQKPLPEKRREEEELKAKAKALVHRTDARFDEFWSAYPVKKGRAAAMRAWRSKGCDQIADQILAHVKRMAVSDDDWLRGYVPHGSTYVNGERWNDEPRAAARAGPAPTQSKTLSAIQILEGLKHGMAENRDFDRAPKTLVLGFGEDPGD